jgi:hypothetical protein
LVARESLDSNVRLDPIRTEIPFDQDAQGADQLRKLEREEDVMGSVPDRSVQLLASILICGIAMTVSVAAHALQGDKDRIDKTLEAISAGNKISSKANIIGEAPAALDPNLKTFTVFSWTSTSRNILNPYDLVFNLRRANNEISGKEAKEVWNTIAESALKGEDLAKFMKHLQDDE